MGTIRQTVERGRFDAELARSGCVVVSTATLRPQDLLPKLLDALQVVAPEAHQELVERDHCGHVMVPEDAWAFEDHGFWDSEECSELVNEILPDALNEHAPEGFHFGSHEGDGACFGFWKTEDE